MPEPTPRDPSPKELAQAKLRARAARIARMRQRVIAASLATFALAFGAIAWDGSMGAQSSASSGTQTTASSSSGSSTSSSDDQTSSSENPTTFGRTTRAARPRTTRQLLEQPLHRHHRPVVEDPMLAAAVPDHLFWITSRAAGTAALLLSSLAVCVGLLFGGKLVKGRPDLRHLHEALSLATIVALVVHAVALLGDSFLHPSVADITIPFVSGYMRLWTTVGIVARLGHDRCSASPTTCGTASGSSAGRSCTASPRWPGSPASRTPSARAPTPARRGSSSRPASSSLPALVLLIVRHSARRRPAPGPVASGGRAR